MIFGETWLHYETVSSTMDVAREHYFLTKETGAVIQAQAQTAGRGRQGRAWFTPPNSQVCLTAIGAPIALEHAWRIALLAGLAIHDGISVAIPESQPRLRFPNDVLLGGKKVAGVLVETVPVAGASQHGVPLIGIGVNLNVPTALFPEPLQATATSLASVLGRTISEPVAQAILAALGHLWSASWEEVLARWHAVLDPEARRTFLLEGKPERCRVVLLRPNGSLTLETAEGTLATLAAAQVIFGED